MKSALWDIPGVGPGFWREVTGGFQLAGIWRYQLGNVSSPFVIGTDLNGDLSGTNDRPAIANPNALATSVGFANSQAGARGCEDLSPTGFFDIGCNPVTLSDVRYLVDPTIRTGIAGRNVQCLQHSDLPFRAWRIV